MLSRIQVKIPSAKRKTPGGADHPDWNNRTTNLMVTALPINLEDSGEVTDAATAVIFGIMEIDPADPIEGVLASQLVVAHEAAMRMYRQAWAQPPKAVARLVRNRPVTHDTRHVEA